MRDTLQALGGWPAVTGPLWKPRWSDVEIILGRLRGDYNEGALFEQWVGPDDKNSSTNILQVKEMFQSKLSISNACFCVSS